MLSSWSFASHASVRNVFLPLLLVVLVGAWLRAHALSDYKFYPDAYQPLLVAANIRSYGSVIGPMGTTGMLYPDFFGWTRPLYPLLINAVASLGFTPEVSARAIAFFAGVAAIPVAYGYVAAALGDRLAGLIGALLLALSYNHAIWGGFILTDTTGVLMLLLTLWLVMQQAQRPEASWADLLTGAVFGLAILARYEYAVLVLPLAWLLLAQPPRRFSRLLLPAAGASLVLAAAYFWLSPFTIGTSSLGAQAGSLVDAIPTLDVRGVRGFLLSDGLLALGGGWGLWLLWREGRRALAAASLLAITLLGYLYYQTNPAMQRYSVHLIAFLLVPASLSVRTGLRWLQSRPRVAQAAIGVASVLALLAQGRLTWQGLHAADNGIWFIPGYEAQAAGLVRPYVPASALIIASFPEPYALANPQSVHSVADAAPFVHIADALNDRTVVIAVDEGMRRIFPHFTALINQQGQPYRLAEVPLAATFRYGSTLSAVEQPIVLYRLRLGDLKQLIARHL